MDTEKLIVRCRGGLSAIVGPGLSLRQGALDKISFKLKDKFGKDVDTVDFWSVSDELVSRFEIAPALIRNELRTLFRTQPIGSGLEDFCQLRLDAVVSLTPDPHLPEKLSVRLGKTLSSRQLIQVSTVGLAIPYGRVPLYQLLGEAESDGGSTSIPVGRAELLMRTRQWRHLLRTFFDKSKGRPVLCVGIEDVRGLFHECLNELLEQDPSLGKSLVLISDDRELAADQVSRELLGVSPSIFPTSILRTLSRSNASVEISGQGPTVEPDSDQSIILDAAQALHEFDLVPEKLHSTDVGIHQALDLLFRPGSISWAPFEMELDFVRDDGVCHRINSGVETLQEGRPVGMRLIGEAGIGKTTTLKRIAFDLAGQGILCLWLTRPIGDPSIRKLRKFVREIKSRVSNFPPILVCVDTGPSSWRTTNDIVANFENEKCRLAAISVNRRSELLGATGNPEDIEIELSDDFSPDELSRLPRYLVRIGVCRDEQNARDTLKRIGRKKTKDVLCALWFLMPQTRSAISDAIVDEYFNLGSLDRVGAFAQAANNAGSIAKKAYEFAAVGASLSTPVPVEILVHGLGVDYHVWQGIVGEGTPLWGLIYASKWEGGDTYVYRTRNEVVTQQLLRIINGGPIGHSGEYSILKKMIKVCDSSSPIYKDFLDQVLIRHKVELKRFDYPKVLALYDLAIKVLPFPSRALEHHRALCIKNLGKEPTKAHEALIKARSIPDSPYSGPEEAPENIETSAAAAVLDAVNSGELDRDKGAELVRDHTERAISLNPYNLHTYHVSANHMLSIVDKVQADSKLKLTYAAEAARTIRRALFLASGQFTTNAHRADSVIMLQSLRSRICESALADDDLPEVIDDLVRRKQLDDPTLVAACRLLLLKAQDTDQGRRFNSLSTILSKIYEEARSLSIELSPALHAIRVELMTDWNVKHSASDECWRKLLQLLGYVLSDEILRMNPMWKFWQAVAHFHLGDRADASAIFHSLRSIEMPNSIKFQIRAFLRGQDGSVRQLTGTVARSYGIGSKKFVNIDSLSTDVQCQRGSISDGPGATVVVNVGFSFAGPTAVSAHERP